MPSAEQITAIGVVIGAITGLIYAVVRLIMVIRAQNTQKEILVENKRQRRLLAEQCGNDDERLPTGEFEPYTLKPKPSGLHHTRDEARTPEEIRIRKQRRRDRGETDEE